MSQHKRLGFASAIIIIVASVLFSFRSINVADDPTNMLTWLFQDDAYFMTETNESLLKTPGVLFHNEFLSSAKEHVYEVGPEIIENYVLGTNHVEQYADFVDDIEEFGVLILSILCLAPMCLAVGVLVQTVRRIDADSLIKGCGMTAVIVGGATVLGDPHHARIGAYLLLLGGLGMANSAFPEREKLISRISKVVAGVAILIGLYNLLSPPNLPRTMVESEAQSVGDESGVWTFKGHNGYGIWPTGQRCTLTLTKDGYGDLIITRYDIGGPTTGLTAIYKGVRHGHSIDIGTVTWKKPWGEQDTSNWSAVIKTTQ